MLFRSLCILEIGPGIGLLGIQICKLLSEPSLYCAIDQDLGQVARAKENFSNAGLSPECIVHASVLDLGTIPKLSTEKFDLIFCRWVMAHISADKRQEVIKALYERLSPGGSLVCEEGDVSCTTLKSKKDLEGSVSKRAFDTWYAFSFALEKLFPLNLRLGSDMTELLRDYTKQEPRVSIFQPKLALPEEKIMLSYAIASTRLAMKQVIENGLLPSLTDEAGKTLEDDLITLANDSDVTINYIKNYITVVTKPLSPDETLDPAG